MLTIAQSKIYAERKAVLNAIANGATSREQIQSQTKLSAYCVINTLNDLRKLGQINEARLGARTIRYCIRNSTG